MEQTEQTPEQEGKDKQRCTKTTNKTGTLR